MKRRVTSEEIAKIIKSEGVNRRYYYPFEYLKDLYEIYIQNGDSDVLNRVDNICEISYKNLWLGCDYMGTTEDDKLDIQIYMCVKHAMVGENTDSDGWAEIECTEWIFNEKMMESIETFETELLKAMLDKARELNLPVHEL